MNVLIIDDEDNVREFLRRYLERRGNTVFSASDGEAGLRLLEECSLELVITDVQMPGISGLRVLQAVKDRQPEVPVIVVTGHADKDMAIQAVNRGAFALLQKPLDLMDLGLRLDEAFGVIRARREERERLRRLRETAQDQLLRLEQERAFSAAILKNVSFPVCLIDREGRVRMANPAFREHFVRDRGEVEGEALEGVVQGVDLRGCLSQAPDRDVPGAWIEVYCEPGSDRRESRYFEVRGFFIDAAGADVPERLTCLLMQDVTPRVKMREMELQLIHAGQLRSLGEMAAGVAHELNQPLSGIRTFAEGMLYGLKNGWDISEAEVREALQDIVEQADRMTAIIDHMRAFSRDSSEEAPVSFQVGEVIQNVFRLVGSQLRVHGVTVRVEVPAGLPGCRGWPRQVEQVLLNLIVNARQAMDGRAARMKAGEAPADPAWRAELGVQVEREPGRVRVAISDTGGGIPEEVLPRIFEPFFTSKEAGQGTGLGLSISASIVQRHGGRIEVINRPGEGATFEIVLPVESEE
jgi:signal transduction histidine kinase/FixJ family two-component response regulator